MFKVQVNQLPEAVVAFLAAFYLLDIDYPKCHEIGMNVLQYCIFEDKNVPKDIAAQFNAQQKVQKRCGVIDSQYGTGHLLPYLTLPLTKGLFM